MQRLVDNVLAVTKESVKTFAYESLNNIVRLINGVSALVLALLPGKATILEGLHGWELRPTFRGPRLPRWMGNGVSSFNQFIHELSVDSDASSLEYSSGEDSDEDISPVSHMSQSSQFSQGSRIPKYDQYWEYWAHFIGNVISWILFPLKILVRVPCYFYRLLFSRGNRSPTISRHRHLNSPRRLQSLKDQVVHHATDRRRGVIEDLQLAIEISIEAIFDAFRKASHFVLAPVDTFQTLSEWIFHSGGVYRDVDSCESTETIPMATLGDNDPTPTERKTCFSSLNTDARTCQDVITELGYPYEAIHVVTDDGYILLLERIPRRDSRKAVFLQHGVFDSSMGWISNGVVGSPAFAAFDQGYDVFLGNFRGLVSREHVDESISSKQYWAYSINEHGTADIPAIITKIHEVKTAELRQRHPELKDEDNHEQLYKLCAISHSLGGAAVLMYTITSLMQEKPHRLSSLILLSPAGFHDDSAFVFTIFEYAFIAFAPILSRIVPAFYIPTRFFRMLLNKLARDFHNYPAIGGLVQTLVGYVVGGDGSNWIGVLGLPHYNMNDMPGVSFCVALHLAQMKHSGRFRMFDYGKPSTNMQFYSSPEPIDLGEHYGLIDIPVDLVAGRKDKVIRPSMVRKHYKRMTEAGVDVSYNQFEYAHLDFTFSHREELLAYVMSRLQLVKAAPKEVFRGNSIKSDDDD
ncbi:hypothetical protein Droror1_Dr00026783 [Drosera rotundifolia]